jgi:hypothetical protein
LSATLGAFCPIDAATNAAFPSVVTPARFRPMICSDVPPPAEY